MLCFFTQNESSILYLIVIREYEKRASTSSSKTKAFEQSKKDDLIIKKLKSFFQAIF